MGASLVRDRPQNTQYVHMYIYIYIRMYIYIYTYTYMHMVELLLVSLSTTLKYGALDQKTKTRRHLLGGSPLGFGRREGRESHAPGHRGGKPTLNPPQTQPNLSGKIGSSSF